MPKKPGRGPKKQRGGPGGAGSGGPQGGGPRQGGGRGRPGRGGKRGGSGGPGRGGARPEKSDYFMQPGRRGIFIVLRRPIGNRIDAKVCGTMPSRVHAKMLIQQLERAESVVKDLFMEATDDGIEALEAVLAASCEDVLRRGPPVRVAAEESLGAEGADIIDDDGESLEESRDADEG
jgi:hypothetical protein